MNLARGPGGEREIGRRVRNVRPSLKAERGLRGAPRAAEKSEPGSRTKNK